MAIVITFRSNIIVKTLDKNFSTDRHTLEECTTVRVLHVMFRSADNKKNIFMILPIEITERYFNPKSGKRLIF
jgi:hypothetical protein